MVQSTCIVIHHRDAALLEQLFTCKLESQAQKHAGAFLPPDLVNMVAETADTFRQHFETLQTKRSTYKAANLTVRQLESVLQKRARHALQSAKRHSDHLREIGVSPSTFGLTEAALLPEHLRRMREPLQVTKNILSAHRLVEAAGGNCLFDPTPEELQKRVEALEAALLDRKYARDEEQSALARMRAARSLAHRVLRTVRLYLTHMSVGIDKVSQRQILAGYGFRYVTVSKAKQDDSRKQETTPDSILESGTDSAIEAKPSQEGVLAEAKRVSKDARHESGAIAEETLQSNCTKQAKIEQNKDLKLAQRAVPPAGNALFSESDGLLPGFTDLGCDRSGNYFSLGVSESVDLFCVENQTR